MNIIKRPPTTMNFKEWNKTTEIQTLEENIQTFDEIEDHILGLCNALRHQESLTEEIKKGNMLDPVNETGYILGKLREMKTFAKSAIEDLK